MTEHLIGTCSLCEGRVIERRNLIGRVIGIAKCESCGAVVHIVMGEHGICLPMRAVAQRSRRIIAEAQDNQSGEVFVRSYRGRN